jgi:RNA polymerase sigma factor (sigma-70 family)
MITIIKGPRLSTSFPVRAFPPGSLLTDASVHCAPRRNQHLVYAAQSGCRAAFDELVSLHSRRVRRTILAITKDSEDAEDAMQESFLRAFLAISRFEGRASFYSWLTRIAINSALMILRRRRARPEFSRRIRVQPASLAEIRSSSRLSPSIWSSTDLHSAQSRSIRLRICSVRSTPGFSRMSGNALRSLAGVLAKVSPRSSRKALS